MAAILERSNLLTDYVYSPSATSAIESDQIAHELSGAVSADGLPMSEVHGRLNEYEHLVLARDRKTGQCLGMLGAADHVTDRGETFLLLGTAFVAERARGFGVVRRMVAMAVLRSGNGDLPRAVAARTRSVVLFRVLSELALAIPGATMYPGQEKDPIELRAAGLAHRIARSLARNLCFDAGSGRLRGGWIAEHGAVAPSAPSAHEANPWPWDRTLGAADQVIAVADLSRADERVAFDSIRHAYRKRVTASNRPRAASAAWN